MMYDVGDVAMLSYKRIRTKCGGKIAQKALEGK